jgi:SAM-dependent methyltransferase
MRQPHFVDLDAAEEHHFWFRSRRRVIGVLAGQLMASAPPDARVLEIGCGTGGLLRVLDRVCPRATVVGLDLFAEGLGFARDRSAARLVQGDAARPPFRRSFRLVGMFDVLEHLADDVVILRAMHDIVTADGCLLLTVPGHPRLWSYADEASQHHRRYTLEGLTETLRKADWDVEYATHFMAATLPLVWVTRIGGQTAARLRRRQTASMDLALNELRIGGLLNAVCGLALRPETYAIARRWRLRAGSSILAVARPASRA